MEEKEDVHSAGVFSAIFVRDSFMLPNSGYPQSVNLGVNCKDEPAVPKIKTEVNDLCVSSNELCDTGLQGNVCDTGLQGNVCDTEVMPPELNTTFIKGEYMEENFNSDNNPVQDPLLLTEKDYLDFAKRENLKIDLNLDDKNIIRSQINSVGSDHERSDSNSFIKKENTEDSRVSLLIGEESRVEEDGGSSTEVMTVASRKEKQTCVKGIRRKKGELPPSNDITVNQAFKHRMCSPASNKCSIKPMMKTNHGGESNSLTAPSLAQQNHFNRSSEFTTDGEQKVLRTTHTGDEPFKCSDCEYKCYNKGHLRKHTMNHTKPFQCTICDHKCSQKRYLKSHLLSHTGEKPFQCTVCDYKSSQKQNFKRHLLSHSGDKPFQCAICDYKSCLKRNLKSHLLSHSGDKPFQCAICDYKCSQKQDLKRHLMTHSGEKPFQCTICDYKCSQKQDLKRHLMTHSGDKPFQCTICDYKCSRKANLKRHSMTHTLVKTN